MRAFIVALLALLVLVVVLSQSDLSPTTGRINGKSPTDVECTSNRKPFAFSLEPSRLVCVNEETYNKYNIGDFYNG